jgi:4-amino-4-deoxy-L-arabinose transferase-like glycosyltransferase
LRRNLLPIICVLALVSLVLHLFFALGQQTYSFPDDLTYVSAAIHLVLGNPCAPLANNECNYEHPPLAKLVLALGFEVFGRTQVVGQEVGVGINQLGGRFFQIVMNATAAPMLFLLVRKTSKNEKMAFFAALFLLVDPLYFAVSTSALLDNAMVFFALAALLSDAYGSEFGRGGPVLTGTLLGLSLLSKETAVFIIAAFLSYVLLVGDGGWRKAFTLGVLVSISCAAVFLVGLEAFDLAFTQFPSALSQLGVMLHFQVGTGQNQLQFLSLSADCTNPGVICPYARTLVPHFLVSQLPPWPVINGHCPECWGGTNPLDWLTYIPPVVFPTDLVLAVNYPLVWLSFAWVPLAVLSFRRLRSTPEGKVLVLALLLFLWNVGSNLWLFQGLGRGVFEWYILPAVPAFAIGGAYLVTRPSLPRPLAYALVGSVLLVAALLSPLSFAMLFHV